MTTHSSVLAWRIPWTEEPGGLQSTGSPRVGQDWATKHRKEQVNEADWFFQRYFNPASLESTPVGCVCVCVSVWVSDAFSLGLAWWALKCFSCMLSAVPGLRCPAGFSGCAEWASPGRWPIRAAWARGHWASGLGGLSSCGPRGLRHRLSVRGPRAQLLCGTWDLPAPGVRLSSPALAGGFFTSEPTSGALLAVFVRNFCVYVPDGSWCLVFFFLLCFFALVLVLEWSSSHRIQWKAFCLLQFPGSICEELVFFPEMCGRIHHWNHLDLESSSWKISFPESSGFLINVSLFRLFFLLIFVNLCVS